VEESRDGAGGDGVGSGDGEGGGEVVSGASSDMVDGLRVVLAWWCETAINCGGRQRSESSGGVGLAEGRVRE